MYHFPRVGIRPGRSSICLLDEGNCFHSFVDGIHSSSSPSSAALDTNRIDYPPFDGSIAMDQELYGKNEQLLHSLCSGREDIKWKLM